MSAKLSLTAQASALEIHIEGAVVQSTVPDLWATLQSKAASHYQSLSINLAGVKEYDLAGAVFIDNIKNFFSLEVQAVTQATEGLQSLLDDLKPEVEAEIKKKLVRPKKWSSIPADIGRAGVALGNEIYRNLIYTGEVCHYLWVVIRKPRLLRWRDVMRVIEQTGPNALPIIALLGFIIGLILSFQASIQLERFGATIFVVNLVGIGLTRELSGLLTAVILAGRTASSFAAEIGTMKVNQELDALSTMGLSSVRFLVVPRVIAVTLMLPILSVFMSFFGILGCGVFMAATGTPWAIFLSQLESAVTLGDFWGGLFKALIFGVFVAAIGCANGLKTGVGASAVGESTTRAVVGCIVTLIIIDGIFAILFYSAGL